MNSEDFEKLKGVNKLNTPSQQLATEVMASSGLGDAHLLLRDAILSDSEYLWPQLVIFFEENGKAEYGKFVTDTIMESGMDEYVQLTETD